MRNESKNQLSFRQNMQTARVWRQKVCTLDHSAPYSLISRALVEVRRQGLQGERGFKVLLGVRRQIKRSCRMFYQTIMLNKSAHYQYCGGRFPTNLSYFSFSHALQAHTIARLNQFKAWSMQSCEESYAGLRNQEILCEEAFDENVVVMEVVRRWQEEAERCFIWSKEQEDQGIFNRIELPPPNQD